jgi:actin
MSDYSLHVVIDNGTYSTKAGFNGENAPRSVVPTLVGNFKPRLINLVEEPDKTFIGREALSLSHLDYSYPIKNGIIDADKMEPIWSYLFNKGLNVKPEAHNVFLTESINSSNSEREKIAEIMFEKFSIFNIHIEPQQVMTLYSTTKTTGLIVESGESMTHIVPIYEGYIIPQGIKSIPLAGGNLTETFMDLEREKLSKNNVGNLRESARKIKESFAEVLIENNMIKTLTNDLECIKLGKKSNKIAKDDLFELPDGNRIKIGDERFLATERFFNPEFHDFKYDNATLQNLIYDSVENCDIFLRKDFLSNIVLGGGNTLVKNFPERLKNELLNLYKSISPQKQELENSIKINAENERAYSSWIGASIICSISNFQQMWISKNDYEENGKNVIHKKYII